MKSFVTELGLKELAKKLFDTPSHADYSQVESVIESWLKEVKKPELAAGYSSTKLYEYMKDKLPTSQALQDKDRTVEIIEFLNDSLIEQIKNKVDVIASSELPIIVYTGSEENVPEIFERINSQGIKLSKYETFAATWTDIQATIVNQDIREKISDKYAMLKDAGYSISGIEDLEEGEGQYNLFEYLFGLGKILSDKYEYLFPESEDADDLVSASFVMTTIAHKLKTSEMSKLASKLKEMHNGGSIDLSAFEAALFNSCDAVQNSLKKYMSIKLNSAADSKRFLPHSENQIYSLIVRYLIEKYDIEHNWSLRPEPKTSVLLKNIPLFYLLDVLNGEWAGSGDTRLWNTCWIAEDDGTFTRANQYLNTPSKQSWEDALNNWHNKELGKLQFKRTSISADSKLVMKYIYAEIVTVADDVALTFHIEHLWSVKALTDLIQASATKEGWPISAISNLSILTNKVNTMKLDVMLGDFKNSSKGSEVTDAEWSRIQEWLINPSVQDIKHRADFTKEEFIAFCDGRFVSLKSKLLSQLGY
jgi:vacuolar-type H+-ATPase subunit F/Vma7